MAYSLSTVTVWLCPWQARKVRNPLLAPSTFSSVTANIGVHVCVRANVRRATDLTIVA